MSKKILAVLLALGLTNSSFAKDFLNVSYDPTRELYQEYNVAFAKHWKSKGGEDISFKQSHGGSGKQGRSVIDGLEADVVTLALAYDIDALAQRGLIPENWQTRLPNSSSPYTSTIVFLVRKGNPKNIKDWNDLVKAGVEVVTPNPKTSGGARWNYLAAWGYALRQPKGNADSAQKFLKQLYQNVKVLDSGARGSLTTFAERGIGDVLLAWENEAYLAVRELGPEKFEIVTPSVSILAEPPVTVVDKYAKKHGTVAKLPRRIYSICIRQKPKKLQAKNYYRPTDAKIAAKYAKQFAPVKLFTIKDFGGWSNAATSCTFALMAACLTKSILSSLMLRSIYWSAAHHGSSCAYRAFISR
jgi:sulfate/thiosulfate-binding protein